MTTIKTILAVCLLAGTALAQAGDPQPQPQPGDPQPQPPIEQPPQPPQPPHPRPRPPIEEPPPVVEPAADRPTGFSLGIGVGYRIPTSLQTPNITSVRFRFAGMTLEPTLTFASTSHSTDTGSAQTREASEAGVGVLGRFPVVTRKRTELEILGGVGFDYLGEDPDNQNSDDVTTTTTVTARYGVAVGFWITPHVQASLSATNSLVSFAKRREEMGLGSVLVTSDTTFGLIFDPTVAFMIHLYN